MTGVRRGAIIGFGNSAALGHLAGWRERAAAFSIVAVADPDPERRALALELIPGVRAYSGTAELLRDEELDFVDIATPPTLHAPAIVAAAAAGVDVLCEKPLSVSVADYRAARTAVQRAGVVLYTVHNWKYSEAFRAAHALLAAGRLGPLHSISFDTARNGYAAGSGDWRVRPSLAGGGILVDHGWHTFYLLLAFANEEPRRIRATLERRRYVNAGVEDTATCAVEFPSLVGEIRLSWAAVERRTQWQLVGERGRLTVDDDALIVQTNGSQQRTSLASPLSAGSQHPDWFAGVIDAFREELEDPSKRGTNQREAERCLLLLHLAYQSAHRRSQPLDIPTGTEWLDEARW